MKRAQTLLVSVLLAASALLATAPGTFAYRSDTWSNSNSFTARCLGFNDTYPQQLYYNAQSLMSYLGYSPRGGALGSGFTKSAFLGNVLPDWALYVHTHGDNYWSSYPNVDSGFLQDPGPSRCSDSSQDMIRSSTIKARTLGSPYNLVIMSTCKLGSASSTMPDAFQIPKTKTNTSRTFYLGYVYTTYDSAALQFEQNFLDYLVAGGSYHRSLYGAFLYATYVGGYEAADSSNPFQANWWGNPYYDGTPG